MSGLEIFSSTVSPMALIEIFKSMRFRFTSESELQEGIALALGRAKIGFKREFVLSSQDRPDFMIENGVVIEVKIQGSLAQAIRQVDRYAKHQDVQKILLIGSPHWLIKVPSLIGGKMVYSHRITESLL